MLNRKIIALFLFSALILGVCSSCAAEKPEEGTQKGETAPAPGDPETDPVPAETEEEPPEEPGWKKDGVLRVLTIGNSFSDDTMSYFYQIAASAGVEKIELGNLYIGGCSLATHAANARADKPAYEYRVNTAGSWSTTKEVKMSDALASRAWDFISLQQASGSSGERATYQPLEYLISYVREHADPSAVLVWNITWAYQQNSTHSAFPKYGSDQLKMYQSILAAVSGEIDTKEEIAIVSPTGTAIQNARTSYVGDTLTRDGYHLSYDLGRYVAGLTFFRALTGLPIDGVDFAPDGVDGSMMKIAKEAADNAIKAPRGITNSVYTEAPPVPGIDPEKYQKLDMGWTPLGYYNSADSSRPRAIHTAASNSKQFYASRMFTREDIPVGSVIVLEEGWQYRPEGWKDAGTQSSRPAITKAARVTVTEAWWGSYTERAFNLSKIGHPALSANEPGIESALVIYVPIG
ncbi:MAG: DUF4886 domain-containing protein [Clostridia bacterium]|nr:DUF4886 domain-containing protein [Clostridia bacterium]